MRLVALLIAAALFAGGCAGDGPPPDTGTDAFTRIQQEVFDVSCLAGGCHNLQSQAGGLVLSEGASFDELVGVPPSNAVAQAAGLLRVTPFEPEASFLLVKLTQPAPGEGDRMPLNAPPLPADQIDLIRAWIATGAEPPTSTTPPLSTTATASATSSPTETATPSPTPTATPPSPTPSLPVTITATVAPTQALPTATPTATPTPTASPSPESTVTLAEIQTTIFTPICATQFCHSAASSLGGLVLEAGLSHTELVNVLSDNLAARNPGLLRVRPGDPDNSFLVIKLEGPTLPQGSRMPFLADPLSAEQIQLIRRWITQGAPGQ